MVVLINEKVADLVPGSSVDLTFKSPVFDGASASRAYSLPFRIAATPYMLTELENIQRIDSIVEVKNLPSTIKFSQQDFEKGFFEIEESNSQYLDGHFKNDLRQYASDLESIKIHSLLPVIDIPQPQTGYWAFEPDAPFVGRSYFLHVNGSGVSYVATAVDTPYSIAQYFATEIYNTYQIVCNAIPAPPVRLEVISTGQSVRLQPWIGGMEGFTLLPGWRTYSAARQYNFTDFLKTTLSAPREDVSFGLMSNPKLYENNAAFQGTINQALKPTGSSVWVVGQNEAYTVQGTPNGEGVQWAYTFVPFMRVRYILGKIADSLAVAGIAGDFEQFDELMSDLVVYNANPLDAVVKDWHFTIATATEVEKSTNVHATQIDLKNHIIDLSALDFLKVFCDTYNLYWDIVNGKLVFKWKDKLLRHPPQKLPTARVIPFSIKRGYKKNEGLALKYKTDDKNTAKSVSNYIEGIAKTEIELPVSVLTEKQNVGRLCCYAEQKNDKPSSLCFMLDRGERLEQGGSVSYMQTASDNKDSSGNTIGGVSLLPPALFNWAWREHARLLAYGFPIKYQMNLKIQDLIIIKSWESGLYRIETPNGSAVIAFDTVDISVDSIQDIQEAKVTGIVKFK